MAEGSGGGVLPAPNGGGCHGGVTVVRMQLIDLWWGVTCDVFGADGIMPRPATAPLKHLFKMLR